MRVTVALLILTLAACEGPEGPAGPEGPVGPAGPVGEPEVPATLVAISGQGQSVPVGRRTSQPLTVGVTDALGRPSSGRVDFTITSGSATLSSQTVLAPLSTGLASVDVIAGMDAGTVTVRASLFGVSGVELDFRVTVTPSGITNADLVSSNLDLRKVAALLSQSWDVTVVGRIVDNSGVTGTIEAEQIHAYEFYHRGITSSSGLGVDLDATSLSDDSSNPRVVVMQLLDGGSEVQMVDFFPTGGNRTPLGGYDAGRSYDVDDLSGEAMYLLAVVDRDGDPIQYRISVDSVTDFE